MCVCVRRRDILYNESNETKFSLERKNKNVGKNAIIFFAGLLKHYEALVSTLLLLFNSETKT